MGIRYLMLNPAVKKRMRLGVDKGALVLREAQGRSAIVTGSAAEKAGIQEGDIILELNNMPIDDKTGIEDVLEKITIGDNFKAKIWRNGVEKTLQIPAEERVY